MAVAVVDNYGSAEVTRGTARTVALNDIEMELADADLISKRYVAVESGLCAVDDDSTITRGCVELRANAVGARQVAVLVKQF